MARLAAAPPTGATSDTNVAANPPLAAIEVDAQGDTAEDPNVIDESTSNSDNDSAEGTDKTTALCYSSKRLVTHGTLCHMNMNLSTSLVHPPP